MKEDLVIVNLQPSEIKTNIQSHKYANLQRHLVATTRVRTLPGIGLLYKPPHPAKLISSSKTLELLTPLKEVFLRGLMSLRAWGT